MYKVAVADLNLFPQDEYQDEELITPAAFRGINVAQRGEYVLLVITEGVEAFEAAIPHEPYSPNMIGYKMLIDGSPADKYTLRAWEVNRITATVGGKVYQGDENSQTRMSRAYAAMDEGETIPWKTLDNERVLLNKEEFRELIRQAGDKQSAIWDRY